MYTVLELSKMYKTSKQTMYSKIRSEEMKPYRIDSEDGVKIDKTGLNALNLLMANSKVAKSKEDGEVNTEVIRQHTGEVDQHLTEYIDHLKAQIDELKREKSEMQHKFDKEKLDLQNRVDQLLDRLLETPKLLEAPKGILSRLFKK